MSYKGGSLYVTRQAVTRGTHALIFRATKRGEPRPHITTGKPFAKDCKAWCVVYTGPTNPLWDGPNHTAHTTAFRSKEHADAWFRELAGIK